MGSVYRKSVTRPLPEGAEMFTKAGEQYARWKPAKGKTRTAPVTTGKDGSLRRPLDFRSRLRDHPLTCYRLISYAGRMSQGSVDL